MDDASMQYGMSHRLAPTQAMQLGVRILQASSMELAQLVRQQIEANPMLEEVIGTVEPNVGDSDWADEFSDDLADSLSVEYDRKADEKRDFIYQSIEAPESLQAHLADQAEKSGLEGRTKEALFLLIDALDERGFFIESPESIEDRECLSIQVMQQALETLRDMDPPGVGARDLQDSLMIQLERRGQKVSAAYRLVQKCWSELIKHKYDDAKRKLSISDEVLDEALETIRSLNPDPGASWAPNRNPQIQPDLIIVESEFGEWEITPLTDHLPKLEMNSQYMEMMAEGNQMKETRQFLRKAYREGKDLINALAIRQETILKLAQFIFERQKDYFVYGPTHLKSMTMEEASEALEVHISTVSRACRDKYISCKWGMREMRSFFSSGVVGHSSNPEEQGENMAAGAVQQLLKQLIDSENPAKPLSDAKLVEELKAKGVEIARRTVAKYRDQMKILPASLRRSR